MNVRKLCQTAILLALCILSQFLKNFSVFITGSFINLVLAVCTLSCGLGSGLILSVITPLTSWWITGSPIMAAMPVIVPCVMAGNAIFVVCVWSFTRRDKGARPLSFGLVSGTLLKALFMWLIISKLILSLLGPGSGLPDPALNVARATFSTTQLITAAIGSALCLAVAPVLKKQHFIE